MKSKVFKIFLFTAPVIIVIALVLYYAQDLNLLNILTGSNPVPKAADTAFPKTTQAVQSKTPIDKTGMKLEEKKSPDDYFLTAKEVSAMENISILDKLEGFSLLYKVSKTDMDRIFGMLDKGLTFEEYESVKSILQNYLNEKELQKLNKLLEKNKALYIAGKLASK